jgi:hypothetical protein
MGCPVLEKMRLLPIEYSHRLLSTGQHPTPQPCRCRPPTPLGEPIGVARKRRTSFSDSIPIRLLTAVSIVSCQASVVPVGPMPMVSHSSKLRDHSSVMFAAFFELVDSHGIPDPNQKNGRDVWNT